MSHVLKAPWILICTFCFRHSDNSVFFANAAHNSRFIRFFCESCSTKNCNFVSFEIEVVDESFEALKCQMLNPPLEKTHPQMSSRIKPFLW